MYTYREETLQDTKKVRTYQAVQTILSAPLQTPFTTGTVSLCSCSSVFSHNCLSSTSVAGILTASYDALLSGRDRLRLRCFQSGGSLLQARLDRTEIPWRPSKWCVPQTRTPCTVKKISLLSIDRVLVML